MLSSTTSGLNTDDELAKVGAKFKNMERLLSYRLDLDTKIHGVEARDAEIGADVCQQHRERRDGQRSMDEHQLRATQSLVHSQRILAKLSFYLVSRINSLRPLYNLNRWFAKKSS